MDYFHTNTYKITFPNGNFGVIQKATNTVKSVFVTFFIKGNPLRRYEKLF